MTQRYYVPQLPTTGGSIRLPDEEGRHAAQVMRVQPGDSIELFDGQNRAAAAIIQSVARREVTCDAQPPQRIDREPARRIVAAVAIPKADRSRILVEKLTELGVAELTPLVCQRSQWEPSAAALDKLRRVVIEACKQCGRNQLMQISPPQAAAAWLAKTDTAADTLRWIAQPGAAAVREFAGQTSAAVLYAVGPEGGFTQPEREAADRAGWQAVGLGPRVYRIETAALAMACWAAGGR